MKFTKEIKRKWLEALRSGEYKPASGQLKRDGGYCCLGVLAEIQGLEITEDGLNTKKQRITGGSYFDGTLGLDTKTCNKLYRENDRHIREGGKDYKTVIEIIEQLETED